MHPLVRLKEKLKKIPGAVPFAHLARIAFDPGYRSEWQLQRQRPENLFQPSRHTSPDRYPPVFSFVREHLSALDSPRLLSFGCSSGEEVFSLRRYFPQARIVGIDINPHSIACCRRQLARLPDAGIRFELAASTKAEPDVSYDAIFCMSVLRDGRLNIGPAQRCDHLIRFDDFDRIVADFERILKPGGYLAIRHSNFRFADTATATGFDAMFSMLRNPTREPNPVYDAHNRLLAGVEYREVIFRKRGQHPEPDATA